VSFPAEINAELELMQVLTEVDEDKHPGDRVVDSEDKYAE
jgi:hypothetical protein